MSEQEQRTELRNYTRWRRTRPLVGNGGQLIPVRLVADLLGISVPVEAWPAEGRVVLDGALLSPDEARLIGVRLIEAAALADGDRAIRGTS